MAFISTFNTNDFWRTLDHINFKLDQYFDMKKQEWKNDIKDIAKGTGDTLNEFLKPLQTPLLIFGGLLIIILLIK